MHRWIIAASCAAVGLALLALGAPVTHACEGELEWESVPRVGIIVVLYKECHDTETDFPTPLIEQTLRVRIEDGEPSSEYRVEIEGRPIGRLQTDDRGDGELQLVRRGIIPGSDDRPKPRQRVNSGDVCVVSRGSERYEAPFEAL